MLKRSLETNTILRDSPFTKQNKTEILDARRAL
jgi:hypothetical protein